MLVCLRNNLNKRTESNTGHPALVGKSRQAVRASSGNQCDGHLARPELRQKKSVTQMHTKFHFLIESFFDFITNTVLESIKTPRYIRFNTQRIQVLWNHIAVLIALLTHRTLTQSYRRSFLSR